MNAPISGELKPAPAVIPTRFPVGVKPEATLTTGAQFREAARNVLPILSAHAQESRKLRRPTDESVEALVKAGLFGIMRPKRSGGPGLELSDLYDVSAILAEGCPGTAWDYGVWELHNWIVGMMVSEGQDEVFGAADNLAIICGVFNPAKAKARRVEGGYMLSGYWPFGSGSTHSNWACSVANVDADENHPAPEPRMFVFPNTDFVVRDTWHCTGLAATGTHDIHIENEIFVPERRSMAGTDVYNGTGPGAALHDAVAYRLPVLPGAHLFGASTSSGVARAAIKEFRKLTSGRVRVNGTKQDEAAAPLSRIAKALIDVEAAELVLQKAIRDAEAELRAGRELSLEQRAKIRMVSGYVPDLCRQVVNSLVGASGVAVLAEGHPLMAMLLDITGMANHASTDYDLGPENYGRVLMGLAPSNSKI